MTLQPRECVRSQCPQQRNGWPLSPTLLGHHRCHREGCPAKDRQALWQVAL